MDGRNQVTGELLINLLSPFLQFLRLVLSTDRMARIVMLHSTMALEAERNSILDVVAPAWFFRNQMVNLDVDSARLLA